MERILLALGNQGVEKALMSALDGQYEFVGAVVYREAIIKAIEQKSPNIVVIREGLSGNESIMSILYAIRNKYSKVRIVFLANKRSPGNEFLTTLVNYSIFDISFQGKIAIKDIISLIREKRRFEDVKHLLPVPKIDERTNKMIFQAPEQIIKKETIVREIYVDDTKRERNDDYIDKKTVESEESNLKEEKNKEKKSFLSILKKDEKKVVEENDREIPPPEDNPQQQYRPVERIEPKEIDQRKSQEEPQRIKAYQESRGYEDEYYDQPKTSHIENRFNYNDKYRQYEQSGEVFRGDGSRQRIITFMGSKNGVGNTTMALNTAVSLAQKEFKVLYMELNDKSPATSYWYELSSGSSGIDEALNGIRDGRYDKVDKAIIHSIDLKDNTNKEDTNHMKANYKKLPNTLDFMFYSDKYLLENKSKSVDYDKQTLMKLSKDLYLYLMIQCCYDYIILDVQPDIMSSEVFNALVYSNKVFITMTQDVSTIGANLFDMNELGQRGIKIKPKLTYIINKYEKTDLTLQDIKGWIQHENIISVPYLNKEFVNANFIGLPLVLVKKNSLSKSSFQEIENNLI